MTFHEELLQSYPPPFGRMFGKKEDGYHAHLTQAKLLSDLMLTMVVAAHRLTAVANCDQLIDLADDVPLLVTAK